MEIPSLPEAPDVPALLPGMSTKMAIIYIFLQYMKCFLSQVIFYVIFKKTTTSYTTYLFIAIIYFLHR